MPHAARVPARRIRPLLVLLLVLTGLGALESAAAPPAHAASTSLVISELRLRGPNGANDEFIEIKNIGPGDHVAAATSGTGYDIAASNGVVRCTIPNGTVIPGFGHFLCVNSVGYSLASYPAGPGTTATGDATYTSNIPDNAGVALFDTNLGINFTSVVLGPDGAFT